MAGYIGSKASVVSSGAERKKVFDITTTTTSLTGCSYTPNQVHVYHNGVRLVDGTDYTATDGSTVTLTTAAQSGDEVVVISYATFQTSDTVSASAGGTFSNAVTVDADGATVLTVDRATSDGTIIDLQKDGSSVGSIGSNYGDKIYIGSSTYGFVFGGGIHPWNPSTNSVNDNAVDLGYSTGRYKDLYLSGGVYLGGTGSANYLDDYETGTFTPSISGTSVAGTGTYTSQHGTYVKVGKVVTLNFDYAVTAHTGSGLFRIVGLPFASASTVGRESTGSVMVDSFNLSSNGATVSLYISGGSSEMRLYVSSDAAAWVQQSMDTAHTLIGSITYITD